MNGRDGSWFGNWKWRFARETVHVIILVITESFCLVMLLTTSARSTNKSIELEPHLQLLFFSLASLWYVFAPPTSIPQGDSANSHHSLWLRSSVVSVLFSLIAETPSWMVSRFHLFFVQLVVPLGLLMATGTVSLVLHYLGLTRIIIFSLRDSPWAGS
jgi:hypothetical protein